MKNSITIQVPFIKEFNNYHEIDDLVSSINDLGDHPTLKAVEVGRYLHVCVGVFYVGSMPSKKQLKEITKVGIAGELNSVSFDEKMQWIWDKKND